MFRINFRPHSIVLITLLYLASFSVHAESIAYVSDQLTVALRSGPTNGHRITKFLTSGTRLNVLETSSDGSYARVTTDDGSEGWVLNDKLMNQKSARDRLPQLSSKVTELKQTVKQLKREGAELAEQNQRLEQEKVALKELLDQLRVAAADPIATADKNRRLTEQLKKVDATNAQLLADNQRLADDNIKEWFMIGGGVALLSLLFGLIIPSFSWGRKKDSWGGGF